MAVRVRLTRVGGKKNAIWRVVVADRRSPRDGRFIEMIGHYNPQTQPSQIVIDRERLQHWLDRGAQPSNTVKKLMRAQGAGGASAPPDAEPAAKADEEPAAKADAEPAAKADAEPAAKADAEVAGDSGENVPDEDSADEAEVDVDADAAPAAETGPG